jgi:hypothetical protein
MIRLRGGILVLLGVFLGGFGLWLLYLAMGWAFPSFVPPEWRPVAYGLAATAQERMFSPPGLAALFLMGLGSAAALLGLGMLLLGRKFGVLKNIVLALGVIFVVVVATVVIAGRG